MKWWYWLILEILILCGVTAWIYFFLSEDGFFEFSKCFIGAELIYLIETFRKHNKEER